MTLTPDRWIRTTSKPSSCCESRRIYDLNIRDLLAPWSSVDVSHLPLGMRMYKVRGDTLHCFRVEIPACVYRLPPQLALLSCQGCKSEKSCLASAKRSSIVLPLWVTYRRPSSRDYLVSNYRVIYEWLHCYSEKKRRLFSYTVIPRLTKTIRSGITFVSRNVISRRFLWKIV